jgi:hypothetical protein
MELADVWNFFFRRKTVCDVHKNVWTTKQNWSRNNSNPVNGVKFYNYIFYVSMLDQHTIQTRRSQQLVAEVKQLRNS